MWPSGPNKPRARSLSGLLLGLRKRQQEVAPLSEVSFWGFEGGKRAMLSVERGHQRWLAAPVSRGLLRGSSTRDKPGAASSKEARPPVSFTSRRCLGLARVYTLRLNQLFA